MSSTQRRKALNLITDASRPRRFRDSARQQWYATQRTLRLARRLLG